MAQINVGAAIGAGFGLIRRRPLSVLAWGAIPGLVQLAAFALLLPAALGNLAQFTPSGSGDAAPNVGAMGQVLMMEGGAQLLNLLQLFISAMISCAVWRAVLRPQSPGFAYMRVGAPELFYILLSIGAGMAFAVLFAIVAIPALVVGGIVGGVTRDAVAGIVSGVSVFAIVGLVGGLYIGLRFVFVGPMMVADGKFHFTESWAATRGRVGSLFLIALGLTGVFIAIEVVFLAVFGGIGAAVIMSSGGFDALLTGLKQDPLSALSKFWPLAVAWLIAAIPIAGCAWAIAGAPWARAYQDVVSAGTADAFV